MGGNSHKLTVYYCSKESAEKESKGLEAMGYETEVKLMPVSNSSTGIYSVDYWIRPWKGMVYSSSANVKREGYDGW